MKRFEQVVAYDYRERWMDPDDCFDDSYRQRFLIDENILKPLSIDRSIWASIFDGQCAETHWDPPVMPENIVVWENHSDMAGTLETYQRQLPGDFSEIAITILNAGDPLPYWEILSLEPVYPESAWKLLGYDVADAGFISGLTNCGYMPDEEKPRNVKVNSNHLFDSTETASNFKAFTNNRVSEHAPFYVFGIYEIRTHANV